VGLYSMRIRNNNQVLRRVVRGVATGPSVFTRCNGTTRASTYSSPAHDVVTAAREEQIEDSLGKGVPHGVRHRIYKYDVSDDIPFTAFASYDTTVNMWSVCSYSQPNSWLTNSNMYVLTDHSWSTSHKTSLPPFWNLDMSSINEASLKQDVLEKARSLKADALLNVIEGNQIVPSVSSLVTSFPKMLANWKDLRKVLKTASGSFLAWKFGVSPILQDMSAIHRYLPKMQKDLKRHGDQEAQRFSVKAVPKMSFTEVAGGYGVPNYQNGFVTSKYSHQGLIHKAPELRYVLTVVPNTKYHTDFFKKADGFLSRFATSPASLAWEKVPFSFVVDWFVDLRGVLSALDKCVGFSPYTIRSFTRSFSYHCETHCFTDLFSPCSGAGLQSFRSCTVEYKHYERSIVPTGFSASWNPRFGKNQAAISAALITQMLTSKLPRAKRSLNDALFYNASSSR